eukprot:TRINITY_DN36732_c0_g1_i1.p1 TRINITY_DN36732_c0_g1~~TRINITY_DN36732_c0_g1_i1.p1  ORF type:complete len:386 (+),score=99.33 TRINITY_DN36732_c0_g1_i1:41-1198(+)
MPARRGRGGRSRARRSPSSSSGSELSFEKEDPLDSREFGEESQTCPICDQVFEVDESISEEDRLPVRYAVQSHILAEHPDPDSPVRKAKPAPKKKAAPKKAAAKKAAAKKAAATEKKSDDDSDEEVISKGEAVPAMPSVGEAPAHIPSDSQTVSQIAQSLNDEVIVITVVVLGTAEPQLHNVSPTATILEFRKEIASRRGCPNEFEQGRLVYNGCRITDNSLSLTDLGIPSGSSIHFVPPPSVSPQVQNTEPRSEAPVKEESPPSPSVDKTKRPNEEVPPKDKRPKEDATDAREAKVARVRGEVANRFQAHIDEAGGENAAGKGKQIEEELWARSGNALAGKYRSSVRLLLKGLAENNDISSQLASGDLPVDTFSQYNADSFTKE